MAAMYTASAQTQVRLHIHHQLDNEVFQLNKGAKNDLGDSLSVSRIQYYLSGFRLIHDGGQTLNLSDVYALVDGSTGTSIDLGSLQNVTTVDSIYFCVGVEAPTNNADPGQYPPTHPLAPKSPSMHWGWASGYRFVALEGKAGNTLTTAYEIHSLGNQNYFRTGLSIDETQSNNVLNIHIDADYLEAFRGLAVAQGMTEHSDNGPAVTLLQNFRDHVFSKSTVLMGAKTPESLSLDVFPNPATGSFRINGLNEPASYFLYDLSGKLIQEGTIHDENNLIQSAHKGIALLMIRDNAGHEFHQKLILN